MIGASASLHDLVLLCVRMSNTTEQMSLKDRMSDKGPSLTEIETVLTHQLFTVPVADRWNQLVDGGRDMTLLIHVDTELEDIPSMEIAFALSIGRHTELEDKPRKDYFTFPVGLGVIVLKRNLRFTCSNCFIHSDNGIDSTGMEI